MFMYYRMTKANKTPGLIGDGCHLNTMDTLGDKLYIQINDILIFVKICSGLKGDYIKTLSLGTLLPAQTQDLLIVLTAFLGDLAHSDQISYGRVRVPFSWAQENRLTD